MPATRALKQFFNRQIESFLAEWGRAAAGGAPGPWDLTMALVVELDASNSALQWMVDSYALVFAGLLLTAQAAVWAARSGPAGFRCAGGLGGVRAEVPKPAADPGGSQPAGWGRFLPGATQIGGQRSGEAELGVRGDEQPGPAVTGGRGADLRGRPAQGLLEQSEGVLEIETAEERLPPAVDVGGGGAGDRGPQPDRLGVAVPGQVLDL